MKNITCSNCNGNISYNTSDPVIICPHCKVVIGGNVRELPDLATEAAIRRKLAIITEQSEDEVCFSIEERSYQTFQIRECILSYFNIRTKANQTTNISNTGIRGSFSTELLLYGYNDTSIWHEFLEKSYVTDIIGNINSQYNYNLHNIKYTTQSILDEPLTWQQKLLNDEYQEICGREPTEKPNFQSKYYTVFIPYVIGKVTLKNTEADFLISLTPMQEIAMLPARGISRWGESPNTTLDYVKDFGIYPNPIQLPIELVWVPLFTLVMGVEWSKAYENSFLMPALCMFGPLIIYFLLLVIAFPYTSAIGRAFHSKLPGKQVFKVFMWKNLYTQYIKKDFYIPQEAINDYHYFNISNLEKVLQEKNLFFRKYIMNNLVYWILIISASLYLPG